MQLLRFQSQAITQLFRYGLAQCVMVFCVCGCDSQATQTEQDEPFAGVQFSVAVPDETGLLEAWQPIVDEWNARTGGQAQLQSFAIETDGSSSRSNAASSAETDSGDSENGETSTENGDDPKVEAVAAQLSDSAAALVVFPLPLAGELAGRSLLAPLPRESLADEELNWTDVLPGLRERVCSPGGRPHIVPLSSPTLVLYYRRDLLQQAGLSPPATWDDYEELLKSLDQWAPGLTAVEPWGSEFRTTMFFTRAVSHASAPGSLSLFLNVDTGEPLIDSPGFARGLQQAGRALDRMPTDVADYSPDDCRREILSGRAALAIAFEEFRDGTDEPIERRDAAGSSISVGFAPLPGAVEAYSRTLNTWKQSTGGEVNRPAFTGFAGYCVGVSSKADPTQIRAALNLIGEICFTDAPGANRETRSVCRESHVASASAWYGDTLIGAEPDEYAYAVVESLRQRHAVLALPVARRQLLQIVSNRLGEWLADETNRTAEPAAADTLSDIHKDWTAAIDKTGRDRIMTGYRLSLGFSP